MSRLIDGPIEVEVNVGDVMQNGGEYAVEDPGGDPHRCFGGDQHRAARAVCGGGDDRDVLQPRRLNPSNDNNGSESKGNPGDMMNNGTFQPINCVSRGKLRITAVLVNEKGGRAFYHFGDPESVYSRPISEFRSLYARA